MWSIGSEGSGATRIQSWNGPIILELELASGIELRARVLFGLDNFWLRAWIVLISVHKIPNFARV
jgi:hypothetical protein